MSDFPFFFGLGWSHIMNSEALDHIFFITALAAIYLLRDWKQVLVLVTAFTIGHAITLFLSANNLVTVPSAWVEFLIPCTIVATAVSNLFMRSYTPRSVRLNYFLALFFGLIHGLAFASNFKWMLAADQGFALPWISFSLGLEVAQILIVIGLLLLAELAVGVLHLPRREWVIFVSAAVFGLALEMAIQRWPTDNKRHLSFTTIHAHEKGFPVPGSGGPL